MKPLQWQRGPTPDDANVKVLLIRDRYPGAQKAPRPLDDVRGRLNEHPDDLWVETIERVQTCFAGVPVAARWSVA